MNAFCRSVAACLAFHPNKCFEAPGYCISFLCELPLLELDPMPKAKCYCRTQPPVYVRLFVWLAVFIVAPACHLIVSKSVISGSKWQKRSLWRMWPVELQHWKEWRLRRQSASKETTNTGTMGATVWTTGDGAVATEPSKPCVPG